MAKGMTDRAIAAQIGGTERQINEQRQRLVNKLGTQSQAQLVAAAIERVPWASRAKPHHT
ncbi:LuxR C-terminal-related transcriptional regulator [Bradyrhizobium sp. Leo121]|uniref:LuxR C-terminal-related transcriptional regulator n=1 Tax=Bradyrhizobium sp. Leo121 TaxID=1571195 RepID=UPI001029F78E|nr:LuxR C-terminal-related transcriptional regulator [Bradyrhizobium sp. Leo121]